jgi:hypothetical protein
MASAADAETQDDDPGASGSAASPPPLFATWPWWTDIRREFSNTTEISPP